MGIIRSTSTIKKPLGASNAFNQIADDVGQREINDLEESNIKVGSASIDLYQSRTDNTEKYKQVFNPGDNIYSSNAVDISGWSKSSKNYPDRYIMNPLGVSLYYSLGATNLDISTESDVSQMANYAKNDYGIGYSTLSDEVKSKFYQLTSAPADATGAKPFHVPDISLIKPTGVSNLYNELIKNVIPSDEVTPQNIYVYEERPISGDPYNNHYSLNNNIQSTPPPAEIPEPKPVISGTPGDYPVPPDMPKPKEEKPKPKPKKKKKVKPKPKETPFKNTFEGVKDVSGNRVGSGNKKGSNLVKDNPANLGNTGVTNGLDQKANYILKLINKKQ